MNRRSLVRQTAAASATVRTAEPAQPVPAEATGVTQTLARYLVMAGFEDLPYPARMETARSLLNWMGVAVGGSQISVRDTRSPAPATSRSPAGWLCTGSSTAASSCATRTTWHLI